MLLKILEILRSNMWRRREIFIRENEKKEIFEN